jgi:hypothetical protein
VDDAFADAAPIESAKNADDTKPRIECAGLKKRCARFYMDVFIRAAHWRQLQARYRFIFRR